MSRKGNPIDDSPIESWNSLLKKETLCNNNITSLEKYTQLVKNEIKFYNITRMFNKNKDIRKMINNNELIYKLEIIIEYLKDNDGYEYKLYNRLYPKMGKPDSNIVEYAKDALYMVNLLINSK